LIENKELKMAKEKKNIDDSRPVYEAPKVMKLDGVRDSLGAFCVESGSGATDDCDQSGSNASNWCSNTGSSADARCQMSGNTASGVCNALGNGVL
jgi:hypothetical protein